MRFRPKCNFFGFLKNSPERVFWLRDLKFLLHPFVDIIYHCTNTVSIREKNSKFFLAHKIFKVILGPKIDFLISPLKNQEVCEMRRNKRILTPFSAHLGGRKWGKKWPFRDFTWIWSGSVWNADNWKNFWPSHSGSVIFWKISKKTFLPFSPGKNWDSALKISTHLSYKNSYPLGLFSSERGRMNFFDPHMGHFWPPKEG